MKNLILIIALFTGMNVFGQILTVINNTNEDFTMAQSYIDLGGGNIVQGNLFGIPPKTNFSITTPDQFAAATFVDMASFGTTSSGIIGGSNYGRTIPSSTSFSVAGITYIFSWIYNSNTGDVTIIVN